MGALADHVRSYYDALNSGDADAVAGHFTDDAVHWYTRRPPSVGAAQIGEHTHLAVEHLHAVWHDRASRRGRGRGRDRVVDGVGPPDER